MNERVTTGMGYLYPLKKDEEGTEVDYISVYCEHWKGQWPEECSRWSLQIGNNDEEWYPSYRAAMAAYRAK
jgi:hypothetical protein